MALHEFMREKEGEKGRKEPRNVMRAIDEGDLGQVGLGEHGVYVDQEQTH